MTSFYNMENYYQPHSSKEADESLLQPDHANSFVEMLVLNTPDYNIPNLIQHKMLLQQYFDLNNKINNKSKSA